MQIDMKIKIISRNHMNDKVLLVINFFLNFKLNFKLFCFSNFYIFILDKLHYKNVKVFYNL